MRTLTAIVLALCLVAFASATCLSRLGSDFLDATSGSTDISFTETSDLSSPTSCQTLLASFAGQQQCCSVEAINNIQTIAGILRKVVDQASSSFSTAINSIDFAANLDQQTKDLINSIPELKSAFDKIQNAINKFKSNAPGNFEKCANRVENYIAGALCSLCRPDFVPTILTLDNSTGLVRRTWHWAPATCDGLATACSPLWEDFDNLLLSFYDAMYAVLTDPKFSSSFNSSEFTAEFADRNAIRPCVVVARALQGNNTDVSKACRTAVCYGVVRGLRNPNVAANHAFDSLDFSSTFGGKRGSTGVAGVVRKFTTLSKSFRNYALPLSKRQASAAVDLQAYDGSADPADSTNVINTPDGPVGGNSSSAAGLFVSIIAVAFVFVAMMF